MEGGLQSASKIFLEICDLPEPEQQARIATLEDVELREEVRMLLVGDGCEDVDLESIALSVLAEDVGEEPGLAIPERIGHYRVLRKIGEGSMGVVFEAVQDAPKRRVALKVMRSQFALGLMKERFELEATVLGRLDHPGIAQIHEAGTFDTGLGDHPFFAMEYVDGMPLTAYAREKGLGVEERLELLARICEAVHHAHLRGVIHRDLKPENLFVNQDGAPKVLDFGVARAIGEEQDASASLTRPGHAIGTLSYMSPEQLGGKHDDVGPASDVYALGVVSYELLSGSLPHDLKGRTLTESIRIVEQKQPVRLGSLDRSLAGDIETVIGKCLEKEPARRYHSAAEMAADLHRILSRHPIHARPPSTLYQMRLFVRRNRPLVIGGAITIAAHLVAVTAVILIALELAEQKQLAAASSYRLGVRAAAAEVEKGKYDSALSFLDAAPKDLRGWEWHYVRSKLEPWDRLLEAEAPILDSLTYSPDGKRLFAALANGKLASWDLETGRYSHAFPMDIPMGTRITAVANNFPDGKALLAAGTEDGRTFVWDLATRDAPIVHQAHAQKVQALSWTQDGGLLSGDAEKLLFRTADGKTRNFTPGISASSKRYGADLGISPDGTTVAYGPFGLSTLILDLRTGESRHQNTLAAPRNAVFSPDGNTLVIGTEFQNLHYLDRRDYHRIDSDTGHVRSTIRMRFSPDGSQLASTSFDGTLMLREAKTGKILGQYPRGKALMELAWRPDGGQIACAGVRQTDITLWNQPMERDTVFPGQGSSVHHLGWSPDGRILFAGTVRRVTRVFDADTGRRLFQADACIPLAFSGDSEHLLVRRTQGCASIDLLTREVVDYKRNQVSAFRAFTAQSGILLGSNHGIAALSPDFSMLLQLGSETRVSSVPDGKTLKTFPGIQDATLAGRFTQDGRFLLLGFPDARGRVFDTRTWTVVSETPAEPGLKIMGMDLSPDGKRLALACHDNLIRIFDAQTMALVLELEGHRSHVACVLFCPDGTRIASSSGDSSVRIWDSLPRHERNRRHRQVLKDEAPALKLLDRLFEQLGSRKAVAQRLRSAEGLDPRLCRLARSVLLRRPLLR